MTLTAHTVELGFPQPGESEAIDPFALAGAEGTVMMNDDLTLVGIGTAERIHILQGLTNGHAVAEVGKRLSYIGQAGLFDRFGRGVLAMGALPFGRHERAELIIPEVIYGKAFDGVEWLTIIFGSTEGSLVRGTAEVFGSPQAVNADPATLRRWLVGRAAVTMADSVVPPEVLSVRPCSSDEDFVGIVSNAVSAIRHGHLQKVVLARQLDVELTAAINIPSLLQRWRTLEPKCTMFSMAGLSGHRFVGASPELLISRQGANIVSRPLAGTTRRETRETPGMSTSTSTNVIDLEETSAYDVRNEQLLLASSKDALEHRVVVESIAEMLKPLCAQLRVPSEPQLAHLRSVTHLATEISGVLCPTAEGASGQDAGAGVSTYPTALELVATLHPTPAVGGMPRQTALTMIEHDETTNRGLYAGPVGWIDARGDGTWVVGIRSVAINGATARLAAGVGIVGASDPQAELEETTLKLTAVLNALAPEFAVVSNMTTSALPSTA